MTTTKPAAPKAKRQFDPDIARLRVVKEAARKLGAAIEALRKAEERELGALKAFQATITSAPEAQRDYLVSFKLSSQPGSERKEPAA